MLETPEEKAITPTTKEVLASLLSSDNPLISLNSGVPTRTTATLTPTTLRNIEETYIQLQCQVESHQNQARFVPPVVPPNQGIVMNVVDMKRWQGGSTRITERPVNISVPPNKATTPPQPKRNAGGRKPNKDIDVSPEEEERRAVRRERNKMAAARCRKRRLDHTNELIEETDSLEEKKSHLQLEIQQLQMEKKELEYLLEHHKPCCRLNPSPPNSPPDVKPPIDENGQVVSVVSKIGLEVTETEIVSKKPTTYLVPKFNQNSINMGGCKRPDSLPVFPGSVTSDGVSITTPTNGNMFNYETMMEGGTGLTPVSGPLIPTCSTQQRNADLPNSDSSKLVTL